MEIDILKPFLSCITLQYVPFMMEVICEKLIMPAWVVSLGFILFQIHHLSCLFILAYAFLAVATNTDAQQMSFLFYIQISHRKFVMQISNTDSSQQFYHLLFEGSTNPLIYHS